MKGLKYIGPLRDHSGYGEASRNYVLALHKAGIPITTETRRFESNPPPIGSEETCAILDHLENRIIDFDTVIVHLTPDLVPKYVDQYPGKYIISFTVWETSLLHPWWVKCCNQVNEVWVPSQWNVEAFKRSGVEVPIFKFPHGIDPNTFDSIRPDQFHIEGLDKSANFVFYSVMQWNARKNPDGLLRAYFNAFRCHEDVRLVLKAYIGRGLSPHDETEQLRQMIQRVKSDMQLPDYPRINLITQSLSDEKMRELYVYGDAYVSLTHGEGFGLTMFEAGLAGKPVIATGMGGNMEFMTEDNSYPVPSTWDYVYGMASFNPWYWGNQHWARPNLVEASKLMRHVYENREEALSKGAKLRARIKEEFSWDAVSRPIIKRLEAI